VIKIDFPEPTTAEWKRWRNDCEKATRELVAAVAEGKPVEIQGALYGRRSIKKSVYLAKGGPFRGKCAYCECWLEGFQHGDIEHFRPKKAVTDTDDQPVLVSSEDGGPMVEHPGYFWLAYEWTNLLPACQRCNQPGSEREGDIERRTGKRNRFPVAGRRAWKPDHDLDAEKPLLINPVTEDPAPHLTVDVDTGVMMSQSERGQACIDVFGLNVRDRLPEERLKSMNEVRGLLVKYLHAEGAEQRQKYLAKLATIKEGREGNHTLAARAFLTKYAKDTSPLGTAP
jgi:hypothetical protein